ncbi:hypothetical protein V6N13_129907 [Hibiscus sabdariffa]
MPLQLGSTSPPRGGSVLHAFSVGTFTAWQTGDIKRSCIGEGKAYIYDKNDRVCVEICLKMASEGVLLYHNDEHISSHIDEGQIYQASVQYAVGKDHLEVAWWGLQKMHARSGHLEVAREGRSWPPRGGEVDPSTSGLVARLKPAKLASQPISPQTRTTQGGEVPLVL